jgi:hypothetical protein
MVRSHWMGDRPDDKNNQDAAFNDRGNLPIELGDSASIDAFDRLRVSDPTGIFESTLAYDKQPLIWNEKVNGTATSTHVPATASVAMEVSASGDYVYRESRDYLRYQPGKSQLIFLTFVFNSGDPNVRKRVGYFSAENGVFLEEIDGAVWLVLRSSTSGSPVETRIAQADWNIDTYADLDPSKAQILAIDLEWLGVGRVRAGFVIDGIVRYAHHFLHANSVSEVYMTSAQLPVRYEIEATGAPAAANTMNGICASVISEGGQDEFTGFPFSASNTSAVSVSGTRVPLLSVRPKATLNSVRNAVQVVQRAMEVYNGGSGMAKVEVVYNGTLTGASFASVNASSVVEVDTAATAISGGIVVLTFFVAATNQAKTSASASITGRLPLTLDIDGANPTPLSICVTNVGTVSAWAAFNWQEYR